MFGLFAIVMFTLALAGSALALPMTIAKVDVDGTTLQPDQINQLSIQRDQTFDVRVEFTATEAQDNVVGQVFISGYEHVKDSPTDAVGPFAIDANTTYSKKFQLKLPSDIQEDSYKLRIMFSDRNGQELIQDYNLKIDEKRHNIAVQDVLLNPESTVRAGSALLTTVRVKNFGQKDEENVKVEATIPALGLSASSYINKVKSNDQENTEELYMRVPREAKAGDYEMTVTVKYNDGADTTDKKVVVHVDSDNTYQEEAQPKTTLTLGSTLENVNAGDSVIFPVTVTNNAQTDVAYTLAVAGASDWSDVTISPTTTQIVKAGESKAFYLSIGVHPDTQEGTHVFTATVSAGNEQVEQIALTANVTQAKTSIWLTIGKVLGIALLAVIIVLVVIGVIVAYQRSRDESAGTEAQTYY